MIFFKPRYLAALAFFLALAGAFVYLGSWQLERSYTRTEVSTEVLELSRIPVNQPPGLYAQPVRGVGRLVAEDTLLIAERHPANSWWVVARYQTPQGALPVVMGFGSREEAERARARLAAEPSGETALTGLFYHDEPPPDDPRSASNLTRASVAAMINRWRDFSDPRVFLGFLVPDASAAAGQVSSSPSSGLTPNTAGPTPNTAGPAPLPAALGLQPVDLPAAETERLNWLNLFYALEWFVFAAFCPYLWYRLVRDSSASRALPASQASRDNPHDLSDLTDSKQAAKPIGKEDRNA